MNWKTFLLRTLFLTAAFAGWMRGDFGYEAVLFLALGAIDIPHSPKPNVSVSSSGDEPEYAPRTCSIEGYPKGWVRVTLAVSPGAKEIHALGGDREDGDGDTPYIGYERILNRLQSNA